MQSNFLLKWFSMRRAVAEPSRSHIFHRTIIFLNSGTTYAVVFSASFCRCCCCCCSNSLPSMLYILFLPIQYGYTSSSIPHTIHCVPPNGWRVQCARWHSTRCAYSAQTLEKPTIAREPIFTSPVALYGLESSTVRKLKTSFMPIRSGLKHWHNLWLVL